MRPLLVTGHDVTRTPNDRMALDASGEQQLLGATAQDRCIFTFNIRDFIALAKRYPYLGESSFRARNQRQKYSSRWIFC
jgi:hypothetical protein